jgi:hypothetical protein
VIAVQAVTIAIAATLWKVPPALLDSEHLDQL